MHISEKRRSTALLVAFLGAASTPHAQASGQEQATQTVIQAAAASVKQTMGSDMPDWLQRTDISIEGMENNKPTFSLETIQPLYQTPATLRDTVFFQGRWAYRNSDDTLNLGLGYRRLLDDKTWLLGVNAFFDTTLEHDHQRIGLGAEAIGQYMTFRTNYYNATSNAKTVSTIGGVSTTEKALDGYDVEIDAPLPYMPWLRIAATAFRWDSATSGMSDVEGERLTLRGNFTPRLSMELGRTDDNYRRAETFLKVAYNFGATPTNGVAGALSDGMKTTAAFQPRDLTRHTLDKVQRHNDIIVERKTAGSGGITIGRGN